ncbi:hypothetical protein SCUP234_08369 [Seiridium cupressi]
MAETSLLSLPDELLLIIVNHFRALQMSFDSMSLKSQSTDTDYGTLLSLRRTCRRLSLISRPLIYSVTHVLSGTGLVLLIRTLLENSDLRPLVHHLGIEFDMEEKPYKSGFETAVTCWEDNFVPLPPMNADDAQVFGCISFDDKRTVCIDGIHYGGVVEGAVAALLCLTPEIQTLRFLAGYMIPFGNAAQNTIDSLKVMMKHLIGQRLPPPLAKVRHLQLAEESYNQPATWRVRNSRHISLSSKIFEVFLNLCPSIYRVETFASYGGLVIERGRLDTGKPTELIARDCKSLASNVASVRDFPRVKKLIVEVSNSPRHPRDMSPWARPAPRSPKVESSLRKVAGTLQHLHLSFPWRKDLLQELGPDAQLTCLPNLVHLKHLHIQVGALFSQSVLLEGPFADKSLMEVRTLASMLPNSLECLELVESLHMATKKHEDSFGKRCWREGEYEHVLMNMILKFCAQGHTAQPYLRHFYFLAARETRIVKSYLQEIKSACMDRNLDVEIEVPGFVKGKHGRSLL